MRRTGLLVASLAGGLWGATLPAQPARPGPAAPAGETLYPLKVAPGGRGLVDQSGRPFLLVGDAAWSLIAQLSDQHADAYLADRRQRGFNAVLVNLIEHQFSAGAPRDFYHILPFTGRPFATPNEAYFAHADHVIRTAARLGMLVLLAPNYLGWACGDQGWCVETQAATLVEMHAWGRYVGNRYRGYDNILWVIGGDTDPTRVRAKMQAMVNGILQADDRHLLTAHNTRKQMAIEAWRGARWLTVNDIYTPGLEYSYAQQAYDVTPPLPFFLIEARYEHDKGTTAQALRAESYWTVLGGGFGHVFGNCPIWTFGAPGTHHFCATTNWAVELGGQGSRDMGRFGALFASRHWSSLVPDTGHAVLTAGYGKYGRSDYATAAWAADSSSIIAYLPTARPVTVSGSRLAGPTLAAWWYDPGTGIATLIGDFPTAGTLTFTPPADGDWVFVADSRRFGFGAPGAPAPPRPTERR